jgi:hypothetical protein
MSAQDRASSQFPRAPLARPGNAAPPPTLARGDPILSRETSPLADAERASGTDRQGWGAPPRLSAISESGLSDFNLLRRDFRVGFARRNLAGMAKGRRLLPLTAHAASEDFETTARSIPE